MVSVTFGRGTPGMVNLWEKREMVGYGFCVGVSRVYGVEELANDADGLGAAREFAKAQEAHSTAFR